MSEKAEDVAKELEDAGTGEIDDTVLEDVSGGGTTSERETDVINGNCGC